jgi:O-antigen ligase
MTSRAIRTPVGLGRAADLWPLVIAAALAALWPLTAYALNPLLLPALLVAALTAVAILRRPEYGIATALALAPLTNTALNLGPGAAISVPSKPLQLLVPGIAIGVLAYGTIALRSGQRLASARWLTAFVLIFVSVGIASSLQAISPSSTVTKVFALLASAALFLAVFQICREREQLVVVAAGAVAGLLLASCQGLLQQVTGDFHTFGAGAGGTSVGRLQGSFGHPNAYGGYLAVLIPLAVAFAASKCFSARLRWFGGVTLTLAVPALVLSYSRGAAGALVGGAVIWLALIRPRLAVVAAVVIAVGAVAFAPSAFKERFSSSETTADVGLRSDIWASAVDIYSQHPLLGVGLNNFPDAYSSLPSTLSTGAQRRLLHRSQILVPPHAQNLYLNVLAEEGILGLLSLITLAIAALATIYRGCHVRDPAGRAICTASGVGIMTLALHSLLDVTLPGPIGLPAFALLAVAAIFVALDRDNERLRRPRQRPQRHLGT